MPLIKEPISVNFGQEANAALAKYVDMRCEALIQGCKPLHEEKYASWVKIYKGLPATDEKNFPWKNASNLVIQVVGEHVDTLRARVLGNIFEIMPLLVAGLVGKWAPEEQADEQRASIEELMNYVGLEPSELDLYRVLSSWYGEAIKFGMNALKAPWETWIEDKVVGEVGKGYETSQVLKYDGPRPEVIPFNQFYISPRVNTIEQADFVMHRLVLKRYQLLERKNRGLYDTDAIDSILYSPDRNGPDRVEQERQELTGPKDSANYEMNCEWDIYECHFTYWHNSKKYSIIYTYHPKTKTTLRAIFNFYPDNDSIFEVARLGYDGTEGIYGYGFCQMLDHYQREISTTHNQRGDAGTLANTNVFRVGKNSKLDSIFSLYPGAQIPADKDEFEAIVLGRVPTDTLDTEKLALQLASSRAGVEPAVQGMGGGVQNPRKGIYSAMGTFAVLQQGNRRSNINTTDMRYAHVKLGRKLLRQYASFGIGTRKRLFGERAELLTKALDNYLQGRIALPIKAANASVNREIEKQNLMLLSNVMRQHYMSIAQLLQSLGQPNVPPMVGNYIKNTIIASNFIMEYIARTFNFDDPSRVVPEVPELEESTSGRQQTVVNSGGAGTPENAGGEQSVGQADVGGGGASNAIPPSGVVQGAPTIPGVH